METQDWYSVNNFAPGSYQITEGGRFNMLLLEGDEKAVAIDGGIGVANLRKLYESITDKPIDFVLTHTHWGPPGRGLAVGQRGRAPGRQEPSGE